MAGSELRYSLLFQANAAQAVGEVARVTTGIEALGVAAEGTTADHIQHGMALDALRAKFNPLFAASRQYELILNEITVAERLGAISALEGAAARDRAAQSMMPLAGQIQTVGTASRQSAAYVGNLSFQLNDIAMMMALGQSPFMLMVQQGPQVAQVFGQMRSQGMAIGPAIAGAFGMMLNPLGLATVAAIGFGAAAVQWFTSSGEAARTLDDVIGDLSSAVRDYGTAVELAGVPTAELRKEFGEGAEQAARMYDQLQLLSRLKAMDALSEGARKVRDDLGWVRESLKTINSFEQVEGGELVVLREVEQLRNELGMSRAMAVQLGLALDQLDQASSASEVAAALEEVNYWLTRAKDQSGAIPAGLRETASAAATAVLEALRLGEHMEDSADAAIALGSIDIASGIRGASLEAWNLAAALGVSLEKAIALSGQGKPSASKVGFGLPGMADPIIGGVKGLTFGDEPGAGGTRDGRIGIGIPTGAGTGGGGGAAREESNALADLIAEQQRQIALLRTTDPIQQEILKNHKALADATVAEKDQVAGLIAERMRLEDIRDAMEELDRVGEQAFNGWVTGAHSFSDAISMVIAKLAEMAASGLWDSLTGGGGGGLLSGLFGGRGGGGSLFGGLLGGLFGGGGLFDNILGLAEGGRVAGPGGPRDDQVLTWTSDGEYIVNAAATAANLPLVEAINAGARPDQLMAIVGSQGPRLAGGGMVGSAPPSGWTAASGQENGLRHRDGASAPVQVVDVRVRVEDDGKLTAVVDRVTTERVVDGIGHYDSKIMPGRMRELSSDPRSRR